MIEGENQLSTKRIKLVNNWLNIIQSVLFPANCVLCGAAGQKELDLCLACQADLSCISPACPCCGNPLAEGEHSLCGHCLRHPPPFQLTISPYYYAPPLIQLITRFKFNQRLVMARIFAELLARHIQFAATKPDCIIPVPLHRRRLRERGYNQSLEIARRLGKILAIPIDYQLCQRSRYTAPQTGLPAKARKRNVKNAFDLTGPCQYQHVAILDDVITTGHTVTELAGLLRNNGVMKIEVWSVARAVTN